MKIAPVSFSTRNIYSNKTNSTNAISFSQLKKNPKFDPTALQQKQKDFIQNGGVINFDTATIDGKPFSGQLTRTYKDEQVGGFYSDGEKYLIEFENKNPKLNRPEGLLLENKFIMPNTRSGKKIIWTSDNNRFIYIETYSSNGKLSSTELTEFSDVYESGKRKEEGSQIVNLEEDGTTPERVQTNILNPVTRAAMGYKTKITNFKNGEPVSEFEYETKTQNKSADIKTTIFASNCRPTRTEETNVQYYDGRNQDTPVSSTKECLTEYNADGSIKKITDLDYKVLNQELGFNPIRKHIYTTLNHTTREIDPKTGTVSYINIATGKPYAIEKYKKDSNIPYEITNVEKQTTAQIEQVDKDNVIVRISNSKNILLRKLTFQNTDNKWTNAK